jgi:DNA-binding beta-propeller fold protein YncE
VAPDGSVFVAERANHRIQKFTSDGVFITKWGTKGSGDGQFQYPHAIAVAPDGSIYVSEWQNHRNQKFTVGP